MNPNFIVCLVDDRKKSKKRSLSEDTTIDTEDVNKKRKMNDNLLASEHKNGDIETLIQAIHNNGNGQDKNKEIIMDDEIIAIDEIK